MKLNRWKNVVQNTENVKHPKHHNQYICKKQNRKTKNQKHHIMLGIEQEWKLSGNLTVASGTFSI